MKSTKKPEIPWHGMMPAVVTPFDAKGAIDEAKFCRNIELQLEYGCTGVVVTGCSGEPWSQTVAERKRLFKLAMETVKGRGWVIAGTGGIYAPEIIDLNQYAKDIGCDGVMILAPYFPKFHSNDDFVAHYQMVSDAVDIPIMLYNVPGYNVNEMTPDVIDRLADIKNVVAIKESTTDWGKFYRGFYRTRDRLKYFTGQLSLYGVAAIEHGCVGAVSGAPNIWGKESVTYYNAILAGEKDEALRLQKKAVDLWEVCHGNGRNLYPSIKAGMNLQGMPGGYPRMPLRPLTGKHLKEVRDGMARLGFKVAPVADAAE